MANNSTTLNRYRSLASDLGQGALNALYPNEFEVYMMSLELTTSDGELIDYLSLPILPSSYSQSEPKRVNIKKTLNGVSVISSKSFVPKNVTMSGDFGRLFKVLVSPQTSFAGLRFSTKNGVYNALDANEKKPLLNLPIFDTSVRTGFGIIKVLQSIIDKSTSLDEKGKPFKLFFHNPTMGESYLCVPSPNALTINQNMEKNMIHSYTLNLTLLVPTQYLERQKRLSGVARFSSDFIQRGVNVFADQARKYVKNYDR